MIVGCTGNYRKPEYLNIINYIIESFNKIDSTVKILVSSDIEAKYNKSDLNLNIIEFDELIKKSNIIIAIGGDGTILSTCRRMNKSCKPIFGIHLGGLGFLSQVKIDDIYNSMNDIVKSNFKIEKRNLLEVIINDENKKQKYNCLNDIVIDHGSSGRVLKSKVMAGNRLINIFESDGVIFSTATGSTAYSLSAGGPIIYPTLDTISIVPICPLSLSARAIVIPNDDIIKVSFVDNYHGLSCTIDGQVRFETSGKSKIRIKQSDFMIQMISFPRNNYYRTLRSKMNWVGKLR